MSRYITLTKSLQKKTVSCPEHILPQPVCRALTAPSDGVLLPPLLRPCVHTLRASVPKMRGKPTGAWNSPR